MKSLMLLSFIWATVSCDHEGAHMWTNRSTIVHLFEWKWKDIAEECERFLAPKGFGGVQISPPSENLIIHLADGSRTWYERYQVMSYELVTRSGNETEFLDMTRRCNSVGVRIYADVVVNHMTGDHPTNVGTAGSTADFQNYNYPAVPYAMEHFHEPHCGINDYNNAQEVRSCNLEGLKDLNQGLHYVRDKIAEYLNNLIALGVAGFRVDAAKHMWPTDLEAIYHRLNNLNTNFQFPSNAKPYIYQEVIYNGDGAIKPTEYTQFGAVTEFKVGAELKNVFRGHNALKWLTNWGPAWSLLPTDKALVFIDNHDTQRGSDALTYKEAKAYKAAIAFMLAHPYGHPRLMSSYFFVSRDQGPPSVNEDILSPTLNSDDTCGNGWACEHRWRQIYQMVGFRNAVKGTEVENWWDNGHNQIAFSRGTKGFIAFNLEYDTDLKHRLMTSLPAGVYCDVVTGLSEGSACTGRAVTVASDGFAHVTLLKSDEDYFMAIHVGPESRLENETKN